MKQSQILLALGFVGLLILIVGGLWVAQLFESGTTKNSQAEKRSGVFGSLFPFGRTSDSVSGDSGDTDAEPPATGPVPRLRKVTSARVAAATFATGITGADSIRYVERETGHVYETPVDALTSIRLTNTTIPKIEDAQWITASSTLLRFSSGDAIENYVGVIVSTTTDSALAGGLVSNYARADVDQTGIIGIEVDGSTATVEALDPKTSKSRILFVSPLISWVPHIAGGAYYIGSAPSGRALGAVYKIENGNLKKVLGNFPGLDVRFSEDGSVLASTGGVNTLRLYSQTRGILSALPLSTLVQKCAWHKALILCAIPKSLPTGVYPDDWLLGRVHTSDSLWFIDPEAGSTTSVLDLEAEAGVPLDVTQVSVSANGEYAIFMNRNDLTLWSVSLTPQ